MAAGLEFIEAAAPAMETGTAAQEALRWICLLSLYPLISLDIPFKFGIPWSNTCTSTEYLPWRYL